MPALDVQVIGLAELRRAIPAVNVGLETKALKFANEKAAKTVALLALPNVPVGATGRLRKSLRQTATAKKANVRVGTPRQVPYAAAIHWGRKQHGVIEGRPFLWDAKKRATDSGALERDYEQACMGLIHQFF